MDEAPTLNGGSVGGVEVLDDVFDRVSHIDVSCDDVGGVEAVLAGVARLRSVLDSVELACLTRNRQLRPQFSERGCRQRDEQLLTKHSRRSKRDRRDIAGRAELCATIPQLGDALSSGVIGSAHLDAVRKATASVDDSVKERVAERVDEVLAHATSESPDQLEATVASIVRQESPDDGLDRLERQRGQRRVYTHTDRDSGMCSTTFVLDPITHEIVWNVFNSVIASARAECQRDQDSRTWEQFEVDAIVKFLTSDTHTSGTTGRPEISVLIDLATLTAQPHADTVCATSGGQAVPVETLRRMACDADILPITLNGHSIPIDVGMASRTATNAQRYAARAECDRDGDSQVDVENFPCWW
jgi:hypothetical protein